MKKWQLYPTAPPKFFQSTSGLNVVLAQLLYNRGLTNKTAIDNFNDDHLDPELTLDIVGCPELVFYNPFIFKDMDAVVALIIKEVKAGHKIFVYGDYDADGVTASAVLVETLKIFQASVEVYLPDRVTEGYGLNRTAIDQLVEQGAALIITVDTGIRNREEIIYAQSLGLKVIVTDHHVLPEPETELPPCLIINSADKRNNYPWPYLAGAGVAFKVASALIYKATLPLTQKKLILEKVLDLVAVGTIADTVNLMGENRLLVKQGLRLINRGRRVGLNELIKISKISGNKKIESWNIGWQIGPRLNVASRLGHANSAFALLVAEDSAVAAVMASELNQRNQERQKITEDMVSQVEGQINKNNLPPIIIGLANEDQAWNEGVIGLVAGRIAEKYYRPTLIITRIIEEAGFDSESGQLVPTKTSFKGSGRSIEEFNLIKALEEVSEYLDKYGGHPMACGFSIKEVGCLEKFQKGISEVAAQKLVGCDLAPKLMIEAELSISEATIELAEIISALAPFGQNNPQPRFISRNLRLDDIVALGYDGQHLKFRVADAAQPLVRGIWAIAFGGAIEYKNFSVNDCIDLAYYLEVNDFNGHREAQLRVLDMRLAN